MRIIYQLRMRARVALAIVVAELRHGATAMIYRAGEWTRAVDTPRMHGNRGVNLALACMRPWATTTEDCPATTDWPVMPRGGRLSGADR